MRSHTVRTATEAIQDWSVHVLVFIVAVFKDYQDDAHHTDQASAKDQRCVVRHRGMRNPEGITCN